MFFVTCTHSSILNCFNASFLCINVNSCWMLSVFFSEFNMFAGMTCTFLVEFIGRPLNLHGACEDGPLINLSYLDQCLQPSTATKQCSSPLSSTSILIGFPGHVVQLSMRTRTAGFYIMTIPNVRTHLDNAAYMWDEPVHSHFHKHD